jgi:cation diffusion facilitator CzcD-associated flavoprotein CzcO/acetyl esterase/lipase
MSSWQAKLATFIVRKRVRPALGDMRDIARVRKAFGTPLPPPGGARFTEATLGGVRGEWVQAEGAGDAPATTLLYLHGGGFVGCSPRTHRPITASLALRGLRVFVPDYRLAPEHPFPAALDDAVAVWRALRAELEAAGTPGRLVVAGDSAGGNLSLALMLRLREAGERLPDAALLFSPATDLTGESPSLTDNAERDAMFDAKHLGNFADAYLQGADAAQVLASPLRADLAGLPPLMVHVSADEALRDDGVRLAHKARAAGVPVELDVLPGLPHVWPMMFRLPEAKRSLDAGARFLRTASAGHYQEELDVVIVGAGLSGVGAAVHLTQRCPQERFTLLEARDRIGGTWDLFRYPGIRSDSDMYTLGYRFKPWPNPRAIADGPAIRSYIEDTAREHGVLPHVRYGTRLQSANWNEADARWQLTLEVGRGPNGEPGRTQTIRTRFLLMCSGYYSYAEGHRPQWDGEADYRGQLVHPQFWPERLDYTGKRVVVIGSGATAVTLVPEMAKQAAHVTMLQRSPTYMVSRPGVDAIAEFFKRWLPRMWAYRLVRTKNILLGAWFFRLMRKHPEPSKQRLVGMVAEALGPGHDIARDWTPSYKPWDQRLCLVPDGDLFAAVREGRASVVTDTINRFTPGGLLLNSGQTLQADIVVAATGLKLNLMGDVQFSREGRPIDFSQTFNYKGTMYSGVPNLIATFGYTNASWTLKADITFDYLCKLLNHMRRHGVAAVEPKAEAGLQPQPYLEFSSGYVQRALAMLPKQGAHKPWRLYQNYLKDFALLRWGRLDDGVLAMRAASAPAGSSAAARSAG